MLFSLGIIGTGVLAIPVLAGSAAYAISGAFKWKNSLEDKPAMAPRFYGIVVVATLFMAVMMLMAARTDIMGSLVVHRRLKVLGWLCAVVMASAVIAMFVMVALQGRRVNIRPGMSHFPK
jgi:Mn2+/Fe2+ NRAMP family transporter